MRRRAILRRLGAASVAGVTLTGTTTASTRHLSVGVDRTLDVSDLSGEYLLGDLLTEEELADPRVRERTIRIDPSTEEIGTLDDCCCCDGSTPGCDGYCCDCPML